MIVMQQYKQIIVFRKFEILKRNAQRETPNLPVKVFFLLLLLFVSFYFILKAEVCSYLLHYRKFQIQEYWFTTSIITWQIQPLLSESWSITGISNFHKPQHINPKVKSFIHRKQFSKISKYFLKKKKCKE